MTNLVKREQNIRDLEMFRHPALLSTENIVAIAFVNNPDKEHIIVLCIGNITDLTRVDAVVEERDYTESWVPLATFPSVTDGNPHLFTLRVKRNKDYIRIRVTPTPNDASGSVIVTGLILK